MAAGDPIPWSYIARRVHTTEITSDSTTYGATETTLYTITPSLVIDRVYLVEARLKVAVDDANDISFLRLREDSLTGTQIDATNLLGTSTNASGFLVIVASEYTATATGSKTFVITGQRTTGTGTAHGVKAGSARKSYITVDLIISS